MASGSTVSMSSPASDMTQVVASTDLVLDTDFNTARTNVNYMLQTANDNTLGTYPPTDTIQSSGVMSIDGGQYVITPGGFKRLQDDVQAPVLLWATVRTGYDVADTQHTSPTWNNLMLNVQDCWTQQILFIQLYKCNR